MGFRRWIYNKAESLKVCGWVSNLEDGSVEALFQGSLQDVNAMLEFAGKGPRCALVTECLVQWLEPDPGLRGFEVRFTRK